ncbi:MAG: hypothetical protein R3B72_03455, partial [Polyangiaceae bacterium]
EQFEAMVAPLAAAFLSRAVGAEVSACAREVLRRYELAGQDLARRDAIDQRLAAARQQHLEAARRAEAARRSLEELARDAGVADPGGLEEAERRDEERRRLEARLASLDEALFTEGMTLDELSAAVAGADVEAARLRLDAIEEELAEVNEAVSALDRQLATQQEGLLRLLRKEGAFAAAADQQTVLARIAHLAERWARLRLASHILEQEVQRYRERNEGPIIRRASAIFPELTLGEYVALRSSYDERDEAELRCLGADGADVGVEALSDGTRDQLYLALRLASLERHAERGELLPLVVDDILVHFDEDRARAALSVLHRFSEVTQVLMFTHHARHVEIARQCLPEGGVVIHELTGGRRSAKAV